MSAEGAGLPPGQTGADSLLLIGASVRALGASALASPRLRHRYPGKLCLLDSFADDDLAREPRVSILGGGAEGERPKGSEELIEVALRLAGRGWRWGGLLFTGGMENRTGHLGLLERYAPVLGNDLAAVHAVRELELLAAFLGKEGVLHAGVMRQETAPAKGRWLIKRRRGAGGSGLREAQAGERRGDGEYLQEFLPGAAGSIAFVANGHEARLLGASLEASGIEALAAPPFRYAGNIAGPIEAVLPPEPRRLLAHAANRIAARFELRGLNGIDYVLTERGPVVLEVNPRYTASMEVLEEITGVSFLDRHLEAAEGRLPETTPASSRWRGKGILWSDRAVVAPPPETLVPFGVRDRPRDGTTFEPGRPLCTLVVEGTNAPDCRQRLRERAAEVRPLFRPLEPERAGPPGPPRGV